MLQRRRNRNSLVGAWILLVGLIRPNYHMSAHGSLFPSLPHMPSPGNPTNPLPPSPPFPSLVLSFKHCVHMLPPSLSLSLPPPLVLVELRLHIAV